ncbi:class I SAM-dependent methyltransferase [Cellulomonas sp. H30R-01]|uniref:class I SAM-dependent methyltransferase n=1 Tax=Cellulomonas sp. H30R-01 TaxID=2704467 RepID=UPI00138D2CE4|nr:class I SAM-dependent methyltransferase [Cellulomonas sp. H30R-01]QHT54691.1 class I SAM-dependent methyltransferase [Cellulomonas sp. H30R-01]
MSTKPDVTLVDDLADDAVTPYLPPTGKAPLLPFYDVLSTVTGVRRRHARLVGLAGIRAGDRVLDLGCGTGNVAQLVARTIPDAVVTGLDPDLPALRRAARKARRARVPLTFVRGYGQAVPLPDASVDHVVSSLALHHVPDADRAATAAEVARVLRPGGRVTILDFGGGAHGGRSAVRAHAPRFGPAVADRVRANQDDGLVRLLAGAGLVDAREVARGRLAGAEITYVGARKA